MFLLRMGRAALVTVLAASLLSCASIGPFAKRSNQPAGWDEDIAIPEVTDLNPDPHILEIELEARIQDMEIIPGTTTPVWSYNGGLPGPLIRLAVGDRLIVHFTNNLPEETTIHWHGVRVPNNMDGAPGYTQDPVPGNGGTFTYDFVVRDAGTFWYHPHSNTPEQVGKGLYGPLLVTDPDDPGTYGDDLVLMFSDMSLRPDGQFVPENSGGPLGRLFGREGSTVLVNGKINPTLQVRQGQPQRWRIINAARSRYYTLRLGDAPFIRLGGDGGLAAHTERLEEGIKVVPSERADVVFIPQDEPGSSGVLQWIATERGFGSTFNRPPLDLITIQTVDQPGVTAPQIEGPLRTIDPIDLTGARERDINLTAVQLPDGWFEMGINDVPHHHAEPLMARVGDTEIWTVINDTEFSHPFHMHGYFFQVLDGDGPAEWKDTVDVPLKTRVRIAVRYDERPGMWMFHCHILDHAEAGMMGHLHVVEEG